MRAVYVVCLRYPRLVACTHILETLVVSSVTPRTAPCAAHPAKMRRRERDPSRIFNHVSCSNSWRSAAGGLMRLGNCASTAVGKKCKVCGMPRVCRAAAGARDGAGNKGGPISSRLPTAQRAARPGSPAPTFPARRVRPGQPDEHRPCSPPALLVHDGKSGAKTRVQAFRSTWLGLAECDHGGHKPGASQRSAQRHTSMQRRTRSGSAAGRGDRAPTTRPEAAFCCWRPAGVIHPNKPCVAAAQVAVMEHGVGAVGDGDAQVRC